MPGETASSENLVVHVCDLRNPPARGDDFLFLQQRGWGLTTLETWLRAHGEYTAGVQGQDSLPVRAELCLLPAGSRGGKGEFGLNRLPVCVCRIP